ncbi:MAG TPA: tetratricopeptide repeat protein [Candidatus Angelobacter sp.]|jgi:tetratricopeptide (TPR) repeat protein|nr:tetratricopeptide repeat protein [Candidatus Angelobacter sp.]
MKKSIHLVILLALLLGLSALPGLAQTSGVKGVCKDQAGKYITDGVVEVTNEDTGRKMSAKTDKNGEYRMIGLTPGNYDAVLSRNGVKVDSFNKIPIGVGDMRDVNFDLKKDLVGQGPSEEELKKQQENVKQNEKIKGINAQLSEARDLEKAGNYDQAITILQQATTTDPSKDLVWAYLGDAYVGAKKYPEAIDAFQKAIAIKPDSAVYHNALANALNKGGQPDKAITEYTHVAQMDPANAATAYFNIGIVNYNTNKPDDAVAAFDKSIGLDANRADAYYYKGMALMTKATLAKDGKYSPAPGTVEAFQKYLELKPDGANAQNSKDMLAALGSSVETSYGTKKAATPAKKKPQ